MHQTTVEINLPACSSHGSLNAERRAASCEYQFLSQRLDPAWNQTPNLLLQSQALHLLDHLIDYEHTKSV